MSSTLFQSGLPNHAPRTRVTELLSRILARLKPELRGALLLLSEDGMLAFNSAALSDSDQAALAAFANVQSASSLLKRGAEQSVYVRPLLTEIGELLGALVLLGITAIPVESELAATLEEICWMAALVIEQNHLSQDLVYRAHHDPLTHLWNRMRMEEEIERTISDRKGEIGLALIGVDRLRAINDVLGSQVGDELLRQLAIRLAGCLKHGFSIARTGGDEFTVLMPGVRSRDELAALCSRLLDAVHAPFFIYEHQLAVRASAGATIGRGISSAAVLQSEASTALRYAKARCRGRVSIFDPSMTQTPPERLVMEQHLRFAMQKREFALHYQPQIEMRGGALVGFEALLRWKHPSLGFISPGTFIPLAEETSLIEELGDWVIDEALRQLAEWQGGGLGNIRMAVNVSPMQFSRANFASQIAQKLRYSGVSGSDLELEITESAVMDDLDRAVRQMRMLRNFGVQLAIDDFGTGHSSLAHLRALPFTRLKVDRAFIRDIRHELDRPPLLASIVQMAHALNLSVVVEGVETAAQLAVVRQMGCEDVQGFFYAKPMPAADVLRWVKERIERAA